MGEPVPTLTLRRVERQHALLTSIALAGRVPRPASALAAELGAARRTVERDVASLREAGVPIESTRGPDGGYRLPVTPGEVGLALTTAEACALVASLTAVGPWSSAAAASVHEQLLTSLRWITGDRP